MPKNYNNSHVILNLSVYSNERSLKVYRPVSAVANKAIDSAGNLWMNKGFLRYSFSWNDQFIQILLHRFII